MGARTRRTSLGVADGPGQPREPSTSTLRDCFIVKRTGEKENTTRIHERNYNLVINRTCCAFSSDKSAATGNAGARRSPTGSEYGEPSPTFTCSVNYFSLQRKQNFSYLCAWRRFRERIWTWGAATRSEQRNYMLQSNSTPRQIQRVRKTKKVKQ